MNEFLEKNGKQPSKICLTPEKENELITLENFPFDKSPKDVFKDSIFGLKPQWDSKDFKVE